MKYKWLNHSHNSKIIVFFNGWGMDESVVKELDTQDYDVIMFYDYNTLSTDFDFGIIENYTEKYLIAWSMGVMIGTMFNLNYTKKIAINGTLQPISDNYGIPEKIYNLTLKGLTPAGVEKFIRNMFNKEAGSIIINRDFENQKTELSALKEYKSNFDFIYDKVLISDNDKIIPTKNQAAFWEISPNLNSGHAPFNLFKKWSEIL